MQQIITHTENLLAKISITYQSIYRQFDAGIATRVGAAGLQTVRRRQIPGRLQLDAAPQKSVYNRRLKRVQPLSLAYCNMALSDPLQRCIEDRVLQYFLLKASTGRKCGHPTVVEDHRLPYVYVHLCVCACVYVCVQHICVNKETTIMHKNCML